MSAPEPRELSQLKDRLREIAGVHAAKNVLAWDQLTYMPDGAAESRGDHLATLEKIYHEMSTSKELGNLLDSLAKVAPSLDPESDDAALIRVTREDFERNRKLPADFRAKQTAHGSVVYSVWKKARAAANFKMVESHLEKTLEMSRQMADYLKKPTDKSIMDPLIDLADPGFTVAQLDPLFADLRKRLLSIFAEISKVEPFDNKCLRRHYPEVEQLAFGRHVLEKMGYDFNRGRLDLTAHPFMIRFAHSDVRITTRTRLDDVSDSLFSTVHEAGHAFYELGISKDLEGTPLAQGASSGIHESQSRLWENQVARSRAFWEFFYPDLKKTFPQQLGATPLDEFHRAINRVERSLIRTDADEVTYNFHVMIRFDMEKALLDGKLAVKDLPEAWNERYRSDLGVVPNSDADGVLQDVHWYQEYIGGLFQGYTIGNILSAQLYRSADAALGGRLEGEIRKGRFDELREWLRANLHVHGRKFEGPDLIRRATGRPLGVEDYVSYLEKKYRALLA